MSLQKGVYSKDGCGKLKSKDSNHTRRSKQNTYHVVNKNIASSKVTGRRRWKRGCLPGHPQALTFWCPWFILGVPWASPSLGSCHSLFHYPSNLYPKLENFTTQNLTENLVSSVSERKTKENKSPLLVLLWTHSLFILVLYLLYSNFSMVYKLFYWP